MEKERNRHRLRTKFALIFLVNVLISTLISTTLTYMNLNRIYTDGYLDELKIIGDYLELTMKSDEDDFLFLESYFKKNKDLIKIPYDFNPDDYRQRMKAAVKVCHPDMDYDEIDVSVLNKDLKQYYAEYLYTDYLSLFENVSKHFDFGHMYFIYPTENDKICYMFDYKRVKSVSDGKTYIRLGREIQADPEKYPNMWETLKYGNATGKSDYKASTNSYVYYVPVKKDSEILGCVCMEVEVSLIDRAVLMSILTIGISTFVILTVCSTIALAVLRRLITRRIELLEGQVSEYAEKKELSISEDIRQGSGHSDEIGSLCISISDMIEELNRYMIDMEHITAEKEKIAAEMAIATNIQAGTLPNPVNAFPGRTEFVLHAITDPAREVGGDFYDFYMLDEDHLVLTIADVSGKGVPAALFMMASKLLLKDRAEYEHSPGQLFEIVNNLLCESNESTMFVTAWLGILDLKTGILTAVNAGHEYPMIRRAGGAYEVLKDNHGLVLAGMENAKYREYEIKLEKGDSIFLYTDGVPEATNSGNELFGMERIKETLNREPEADVKQKIRNVQDAINAFVKEAPQFDDITMLTLDYFGKNESE